MQKLEAPQLCTAAGGGVWYQPLQLVCYANQIRLISAVHVGLFVLFLLLVQLGLNVLAALPLLLFVIDAGLFIAFGATPLAPLSVITTRVCWRWRGNVVTAVP